MNQREQCALPVLLLKCRVLLCNMSCLFSEKLRTGCNGSDFGMAPMGVKSGIELACFATLYVSALTVSKAH